MSVTEFPAGDSGITPTDGGQESGSDQQPTEQQAPAQTQPTQPTERMFRQADVDRIVQERLTRERQRFERQAPPPQYQQQAPTDPIEARLAPYLGQIEDLALESRIGRIGRQYPDFAQNENAVLEHALSIVQDNPAWASHPKLLEMAYRDWKYDQLTGVDVEAIKKQAADEAIKNYRSQKQTQADTTPRVEGKGGGTPTTAPAKVTWRNADELAKRLLAQQRQNQG